MSLKNPRLGNSLAIQWLGLDALTAGAQVQSLVRELRSHKLCSGAKKQKTTTLPPHPHPLPPNAVTSKVLW